MSHEEDRRDYDHSEPVPEGLAPATPAKAPAPPKRRTHTLLGKSVDEVVSDMVSELERLFPDRMRRRPKALKERVLRLVSVKLPPHPRPSGRSR
jgi:hypothetical protein